MPVLFVGAASKGGGAPRRNTAPSIAGLPQDPPVFTAVPATWSPTVTVSNLDRAKWAVFQVSSTGVFTSDMVWQEVPKPSGAGASWTFAPSATVKYERDTLVVKSMDDQVFWESGRARLNLPAPVQTGGHAHALAFVSDMTIGLNIERADAIKLGYMTTGRFQDYRDQGYTHLRFVNNVGPWANSHYPNVDAGESDWLLDACERAMSVGFKFGIDALDMVYPYQEQAEWDQIMSHIRAFCRRVASRNWDVSKYAIGGPQEYAGDNNAAHRDFMHEVARVIRSELPNSLIKVSGGYWNDPEVLAGFGIGDPNDPFVPPPGDDRIIIDWHKYAMEAYNLGTAEWYRDNLTAFEQRTGLVTWCGEYAIGPADGGGGVVSDLGYLRYPDVYHATSRGMWRLRPTYWVVCGEPNSWWRMNKWGTAELHDEIKPLGPEADAYIRGLPEWQAIRDASAGTGGGGTGGGGGTAPPPTGNTVAALEVLNRGQSNAYYGDSSGGAENLRAALASLTGLTVKMISRKETADDSTLHSDTTTYWDNPYKSEGRWLDAYGNYGSAPSGWGARDPMAGTLNAVSRQVSSDSAVPLLDLVLHWEYDLAMEDAASKAAYPNGSWEPTRRIRELRTKAAGKHVQFRAYCPYEMGGWNALGDIHASWAADLGNASRNVLMACGNMMDADHRGDQSHWTDESAARIYARVAFTMARHAWQQGWTAADLSDCPSRGPSMSSAVRSGNSITVTVEHDKGTALVAGAEGVRWDAFLAPDANGDDMRGTGGAILSATTFRVDFGGTPVSGGRISHCLWPNYYGRGLIRDNWHEAVPAKYAGVPNVGLVDFPLRRNTSNGVAYT